MDSHAVSHFKELWLVLSKKPARAARCLIEESAIWPQLEPAAADQREKDCWNLFLIFATIKILQ